MPPVPNHKRSTPTSARSPVAGRPYPVRYSLRLGAGFGSQIAMTLYRAVTSPNGHTDPDQLGYPSRIADPAHVDGWLAPVTGLPIPRR